MQKQKQSSPKSRKRVSARVVMEIAKEEKEKPKKQSRLWIFLFISFACIAVVIIFIWLYLQKPAIGTIRVAEKSLDNGKVDRGAKQKEYRGKYITFMYPDTYVEKMHEIPVNGPVRESIFLTDTDVEGKKIAVVIDERAGGDFEASPSFQMRVNKPKEYNQEPLSVGSLSGFLFKKNTQVFERTFFFHNGNFIASISVTSPFSSETLEQGLFALIGSIRFR